MTLNVKVFMLVIKNKIIFLSSIILLIFITFGAFTTYSLIQLNMEVEKVFNISELRTIAIFQAHGSISNMESELIKLIIANDKKSIRKASIASIRATALLDESLQQLELQLPGNSAVNELSNKLNMIKPKRMSIIGLARSNQDLKALNIMDEIAPITDEIGQHLDSIILQDRNSLNKLLKKYKSSEIDILILFMSIITLVIILLIFVNINLQKAKIELGKLNEELEQKVKARTKQLEGSYHEIESTLEQLKKAQGKLVESEKMASLGGLVSGISHELNTPIGVCVTSSTYLNDSVILFKDKFIAGSLDESDCENIINANEESIKLILSNLKKCSTLIKCFKKISVQQSTEKPTKLRMKKYVNDTVIYTQIQLKNMHEENIQDEDIQIRCIINCPDNLQVNIKISVLHEIMMNLVINSLQHGTTQEGGNNNIIINIEISKIENVVKLTYWDSGKGIDTKNINKIFDPFFTTKRSQGQNGLGLTIVYNLIVHSLNGNIICRHNKDGQTIFELEFPDNLDDD